MSEHRVCLSTWSFHRIIGPMRLTQRGPAGGKIPWVRDWPEEMPLLALPAEARRRLGVNRLEICQMHLPSREPAYLDALARAIADAGAVYSCMPIDTGNISAADPNHREEDCREIEGWIDIAARLGVPDVRVNTNGPPTKPFIDEPIAGLETTAASLRRLLDYGAARDVRVLIENHGGITADPEAIVRLIGLVGPDLRVCVDIGNFEPALSRQRHDAEMEGVDFTPLYNGIRAIAPYAGAVHAKTARFGPDGDHVGWDPIRALSIVRRAGFAGDVVIEYGGGVDPWENAALTQRAIAVAFA